VYGTKGAVYRKSLGTIALEFNTLKSTGNVVSKMEQNSVSQISVQAYQNFQFSRTFT
jgi:hypothetical protein